MSWNQRLWMLLMLPLGCDAPSVQEPVYGDYEPLELCDFVQLDEDGLPFVTIDDYLVVRGHAVPATLDEHRAQFDNRCLSTERQDEPPFAGKLFSGCGYVQYEPRYDESYYELYSYSAETGELVGAVNSSDAPRRCPGLEHLIDYSDWNPSLGDVGIYLQYRDTECDSVTVTYCFDQPSG